MPPEANSRSTAMSIPEIGNPMAVIADSKICLSSEFKDMPNA